MKLTNSIAILAASALGASASTVVVSVPRGANGDQADFKVNSGQTFTTGLLGTDTLLSSIDLVGPNTSTAVSRGPFTVKIWTDLDGDATTWDPGLEVAASDNTVTIPIANASVTANFSSGILADNTVYLMSFSAGGSDHVAFRMGLSAPGGTGPLGSTGKLFDNMGNPGFGDNRELAFTVNSVPEPATVLLGSLGLLALLRRRR